MMGALLPKASLSAFLEILGGHGELHGPVETVDGVMAFRKLENASDLRLHHRTLIPPKKYLLPPVEPILVHDQSGYRPADSTSPDIVLLGLHPCDLAAIAYLDLVFLGDEVDPFYARRRRSLSLVGFSCAPDQFCFCGTLLPPARYEIFLDEEEEGYFISAGTDKGAGILSESRHLLVNGESRVKEKCVCREEEAIREAVRTGETFEGNPLWEEFAAKCLSCGACSLCCPTCYCFDVREYGKQGEITSERLREWDNCLFKAHGEVAGGVNFRPTRHQRFRYRFQHKYLGFGPTRGVVSCVGCGRCREVCPVGIDLLRLFMGDDSALSGDVAR